MTNKAENFIYGLNGSLYINLTNRCCNDCDFCLRRSGDGVQNDTLWLTREPTAYEVIDAIEKADFEYDGAVFCGYGESTYKLDELCRIADYLKGRGISTRLNTNGLGNAINGFDIVPRLKGRIDAVSISLNESDPKRYDAVCHPVFGEKAYGLILDFARGCLEAGIETVLSVVDVIGQDEIEKCKKTADSIGAAFKIRKHITNNTLYS